MSEEEQTLRYLIRLVMALLNEIDKKLEELHKKNPRG